MKADLPPNEDIVVDVQTKKVISNLGNRQRRYVSAPWLVFWLLTATLSLSLWLLRLLDMSPLPF